MTSQWTGPKAHGDGDVDKVRAFERAIQGEAEDAALRHIRAQVVRIPAHRKVNWAWVAARKEAGSTSV